jgi:TRAP transporter TAXI family solute receptor
MIRFTFFALLWLVSWTLPAFAQTLSVATVERKPFSYTENGDPNGFSIELWDVIAGDLNQPYEITYFASFAEMLAAVETGEMDVAIAQADWLYHSYNGSSKFEENGANQDLRFLFSLHLDTAHLVAKGDLGVSDFAGLQGKVVNVGNAGSGTEATMSFALSRYDTDAESYFGQATRLTSREQAQALCDGKIDAFFYTTGVTASSITEATNTCDSTVLNWNDATIDAMIEEFPYYGKSIIPAGTYRGQADERVTWGLPATLVASADADEEVIYNLVKSVFDNFEDFKAQSTLYVAVTREGAVANGRSVPFHPGAERYFRETGLIK